MSFVNRGRDAVEARHEISAHLRVMWTQELTEEYAVPDYLAPEWQRKLRESTVRSSVNDATAEVSDSDKLREAAVMRPELDELWRRDICEWFYSVGWILMLTLCKRPPSLSILTFCLLTLQSTLCFVVVVDIRLWITLVRGRVHFLCDFPSAHLQTHI